MFPSALAGSKDLNASSVISVWVVSGNSFAGTELTTGDKGDLGVRVMAEGKAVPAGCDTWQPLSAIAQTHTKVMKGDLFMYNSIVETHLAVLRFDPQG